tara:strand:+ start:2752 stop:3285 length:534 start_codon:yes stop_codon:yes gene_type:complete
LKIKFIYLFPFIFFLSLLVIFFIKFEKIEKGESIEQIQSPLIGKNIPNIKIIKFNENQKISFSKYKNKRFILNFFASWCLPCKIEAPLLNKVSSKIPIIGIAYKDKEEDMIKFLKNYGNPFSEIGVDQLGSIAIEWGVYGVPETFLIDENGKIIYKHAGAISHEVYKDKIIPFINND